MFDKVIGRDPPASLPPPGHGPIVPYLTPPPPPLPPSPPLRERGLVRSPLRVVDLESISVEPGMQAMFKRAVVMLLERRRLPCNISLINDYMRQEDR